MPTFKTVKRVAFTPQQMFDLVADIERYPEFVPYCDRLEVRSREEREGIMVIVATMGVAYASFSEKFTTQVSLDRSGHSILVEYLDGPFSHLENRWNFVPAPAGCDVDFYITYEFRSRLLGAILGSVFSKAFQRFITVFEERARLIYGPIHGQTNPPADV